MMIKRLLTTLAVLGMTMGPVLAQAPATTAPAKPAATTPAAATPTAAKPATPTPVVKKVNLNTATEKELDSLPEVGKARAKVIMDARAKGPFKDWADFEKRMAGTSVNAGVKAKIKDLVVF